MKKLDSEQISQIIASNNLAVNSFAGNSSLDPLKKKIEYGVDFYQSLCLKLYYEPNTAFLNSIKQENLKLYLDTYNLKDMNLINKTVAKFFYFKTITISARDPLSN